MKSSTFLKSSVTLLAFAIAAMPALRASAEETKVRVEPYAVATTAGGYYTPNRPPLQPTALMKLPPGSIAPQGWLRHQLELDAKGLCGNLPEVSRFLKFEETGWVHPEKSGWEEVSYWLRGYAALGYALHDEKIMAETRKWVEAVMATQQEDGYFGPKGQKPVGDKLGDPWGHMPMLDALRTYYEATGDKRALECLTRYFHWLNTQSVKYFHAGWAAVRWADTMSIVQWLYNVTGDEWLIGLSGKINDNSADYVTKLPSLHNVNLAQGIRQPAEHWLLAKDPKFLEATESDYRKIMGVYGQFPGGGFAGDEAIRAGFTDPRQGFETCGIVEFMRTFEIMTRITGKPVWSDRVEELAFNSLPAALTPDHRGIHYITCANAPVLTMKGTSGQFSNKFTMLPYRHGSHDYRCCPHNYGMGWPNYAEEMWLATADKGLAASLYGASEVKAKVGEGTEVTLVESTDYPFSDTIRIVVSAPKAVRFPLYLRIPAWCRGAEVTVNGNKVPASRVAPGYVILDRKWKKGDEVTLRLPMALSVHRWEKNKNSASVNYGPLTFSLLIPEKWERGGGDINATREPANVIKSNGGTDAWPEFEVRPGGPWNYGLLLDATNPIATISLEPRSGPLAENPFTQEGSPLLLKAKAKRIPAWTLDSEEIITPLEPSPVASDEPEETVTLLPMGAARLRISAFPVIGTGPTAFPWGQSPRPPQSASHCNESDTTEALNDDKEPANSKDHDIPRFTWWDHKGTIEWVQYDFNSPRTLSASSVYWFDDGAGCRLPKSWRLLYKEGDQWKPVEATSPYGVERDRFNMVSFKPVSTTALRLETQLQDGFSGGILE
jgi:hypothetical protein